MASPKSKKQKRIEALERMERSGDTASHVRTATAKAAEAARLRELIAGRK